MKEQSGGGGRKWKNLLVRIAESSPSGRHKTDQENIVLELFSNCSGKNGAGPCWVVNSPSLGAFEWRLEPPLAALSPAWWEGALEGLRGKAVTHPITSRGLPAPRLPQGPPLVFGNHDRARDRPSRPTPAPSWANAGARGPRPVSSAPVPASPSGAAPPAGSRAPSARNPEAAPLLPTPPTSRAGAPGPGDRAELPTSCVTPASQVRLPGPRFPSL